ncbi:MAG: phenyltransferase domain-containing protein [Deltaproteobacteria bacterium]|nr:phenyltransferase domain-containing protein [Deltaproteobacteria bacterium]
MELEVSRREYTAPIDIDILAASITDVQRESGEIPWHVGGKTDPWDHVESAIGLTIGGFYREARNAFQWLADTQLEDGSWYSAYRNGEPEDMTKESNMSSYIAVGLFHYYLVTRDTRFLATMWPAMKAAIDFTVSLQAPGGEVYWAQSPDGEIDRMALLTGSSSIYMSLKCALTIAYLLGKNEPGWQKAFALLGEAIRNRPEAFNKEKERFSMDWFYPILSGAVTGKNARERIKRSWDIFVVEDLGVRCVSDEPWVTMAETSELALTLVAMGNTGLAEMFLKWIADKKFDDGTYWCGVTFPDGVIWPEEKITWTNAAVIMAVDAVYNITPASQLFKHTFWSRYHESLSFPRRFFSTAAQHLNALLNVEEEPVLSTK